jgi:hypothetical protein
MEDVGKGEEKRPDIDSEKNEEVELTKEENIASHAINDETPIKDIESSAIQRPLNIQEIELENRP